MLFFLFVLLTFSGTAFFLLSKYRNSRYLYFVGLVYSIVFLYTFVGFEPEKSTIKTTVYILEIYNTIFCLAVLFNNFKFGRFLQYFVWSLPTMMTCLVWLYFVGNGKRIGSLDILAIMQTDFNEALLYCGEHVSAPAIILFLIVIVGYILFCKNFQRSGNLFAGKPCVEILLLVFLLNLSVTVVGYSRGYIEKLSLVVETLREYSKYRDRTLERKERLKDRCRNEKISGIKGVYVLVIGESHCRDHLHAYGYSRETTPWLDGMKDKKNTILFDKAFSCHTQTVPALSYALTEKNQYNQTTLADAISIVELANEAGYNTYWLSNQAKYSFYGTPTSILAGSAKKTCWLKENYLGSTIRYDEDLAKEVGKIKVDGDALIIFHLDGCHGPYFKRYHSDNAIFGEETFCDRYDNAVLYNDFVMESIYEQVRKIEGFKAMIYCSDHGEDVLYSHGHDYNNFVTDMTHIPMYVLVSDMFIREQGKCFRNLRNNAGCVWTNDLLFNMMVGIMGIEGSGVYEANNDLTSTEYDGSLVRFKTGHGERLIVEDPMFKRE